ncbi:hypothetical protein BU14_0319s0018 [Porphyra umbilicalis]|uniref:NADH dehydrogenase [ubiquinone] 1 beta subcomplex subunit 7 n=1 Tax=Porphyra umbilicalis TaxID=2786 RepID=A0A1X6NZI8_PORUM|nr:hypothetical protein BU14_0319s0018 [Porphyra umbilicalis]|eukprot:OSX73930.1 hypothetical protein BU14_0319s0018 [Porphyra umbilicalis]
MGGGGDHNAAEPVMKVTEAQLDAAGVDQAWRDYCSHLLIPLNKCRRANLSVPWKCVDERHGYEKCQYEHYLRRVREMTAQHTAAKRAARVVPVDDEE